MRVAVCLPSPIPTPNVVLPPIEDAMAGDLGALRKHFVPLFGVRMSELFPGESGMFFALYHESSGRSVLEFDRDAAGRLSLSGTDPGQLRPLQEGHKGTIAAARQAFPHRWLEVVVTEIEAPGYVDLDLDREDDAWERHLAWKQRRDAAVHAFVRRRAAKPGAPVISQRRGPGAGAPTEPPPLVLLGRPTYCQSHAEPIHGAFLAQVDGLRFGLCDWSFYHGYSPTRVSISAQFT